MSSPETGNEQFDRPAQGHQPPPDRKRPSPLVPLITGFGGLTVGLLIGAIGGFGLGVTTESEQRPSSSATAAGSQGSSTSDVDSSNSNEPGSGSLPGIGEALVAEGATLTVVSVDEATTVDIREPNRRAESAAIITTDAAPGQKFVSIATEVENTSRGPWDLTCGGAIKVRMGDVEDREFAEVEELYRIPGNPDCNANTQPGQTVPMTWRFEVPENVEPALFGFLERSSDTEYEFEYSVVSLTN